MLIVQDKSGNGMGVGFVYRAKVSGELEAVGRGDPCEVLGEFNAALSGTFEATIVIERSYDRGLTWQPLTALGNSFSFDAPCEELFEESEPGVLYAWNCTDYASGTINYRISQ